MHVRAVAPSAPQTAVPSLGLVGAEPPAAERRTWYPATPDPASETAGQLSVTVPLTAPATAATAGVPGAVVS